MAKDLRLDLRPGRGSDVVGMRELLAVAACLGAAGAAAGQVIYLPQVGSAPVSVLDLDGRGATPLSTLTGNTGGLEFSADGNLWAIDWSFEFRQWDFTARRWVYRFNLRQRSNLQFSGFSKDLSWDPSTGRLLALHTGTFPTHRDPDVPTVIAIDTQTGMLSLVGRVPGLAPYTNDWPMGLAVDSQGTIWIGTFRNGKIYRLTRTSATEFAPELVADLDPTHMNLEGLAIDWRRGDTMYASTSRGVWRLGPDHLPLERIHPQSSTADIAISPCLADFLTDGFVDFFDYAEFVDAFEEGRMRADLNGDGHLDFFDYERMVSAFEAGC